VRHDDTGGASLVGVYVGYREGLTPTGLKQGVFYACCFPDRGDLANQIGPDGRRVARLDFLPNVFTGRLDYPDARRGASLGGASFEPAAPPGGASPWRKINVVVSRDNLELSWERDAGKLEVMRRISTASLGESLKYQLRAYPDLTSVPRGFTPNSGIGLYVFGGKASFRNIVVQPLR
jgi:hypothetical protein